MNIFVIKPLYVSDIRIDDLQSIPA